MFDVMIEDHAQLRRTAATLRELLDDDSIPIGRWLASTRWALTRQLLRYMTLESVVLGGPAGPIRDDRPALTLDGFEHLYRRHLSDWTPDRIDSEWPVYCRELIAILDALEAHMQSAEREIERHLPHPATLDPVGARA